MIVKTSTVKDYKAKYKDYLQEGKCGQKGLYHPDYGDDCLEQLPTPGDQACMHEAEYVQRWHYSPDYGHDAPRGCSNRLDGYTLRGMSKVPANPIEEAQIIKDYKAKYKDYSPLMVRHMPDQINPGRLRRICRPPDPSVEGQGARHNPIPTLQPTFFTRQAARKAGGRRFRGGTRPRRRHEQRHRPVPHRERPHADPHRDAVLSPPREVRPWVFSTPIQRPAASSTEGVSATGARRFFSATGLGRPPDRGGGH